MTTRDDRLARAQQALQAGEEPTTTGVSDNGAMEVPSNLLEPVIVTQANAAEAYADNDQLAPPTEG